MERIKSVWTTAIRKVFSTLYLVTAGGTIYKTPTEIRWFIAVFAVFFWFLVRNELQTPTGEEAEIDPELAPLLQSPMVDKLLLRYYTEKHTPRTKWPDFECAKAWAEYGRGEMVAFFHQHLDEPCSVGQIDLFSRPGFFNGYLHSEEKNAETIAALEADLEEVKASYSENVNALKADHQKELYNATEQHRRTLASIRDKLAMQPDRIAELEERISRMAEANDQELRRRETVIAGLNRRIRELENPESASYEEAMQGRGEVEERMLERGWVPVTKVVAPPVEEVEEVDDTPKYPDWLTEKQKRDLEILEWHEEDPKAHGPQACANKFGLKHRSTASSIFDRARELRRRIEQESEKE